MTINGEESGPCQHPLTPLNVYFALRDLEQRLQILAAAMGQIRVDSKFEIADPKVGDSVERSIVMKNPFADAGGMVCDSCEQRG